jgi:hypothetical protein
MSDQLELDFGDEQSVLYMMDKRELIDRLQQMELLVFSHLRSFVLQGEVNRVVMQMWQLLNKDGAIGAATQEELYHSIKYAVSRIEGMKT